MKSMTDLMKTRKAAKMIMNTAMKIIVKALCWPLALHLFWQRKLSKIMVKLLIKMTWMPNYKLNIKSLVTMILRWASDCWRLERSRTLVI